MNNQCTDLVFAVIFGLACTNDRWPMSWRGCCVLAFLLFLWLFFC